jgi:hypothetical protein
MPNDVAPIVRFDEKYARQRLEHLRRVESLRVDPVKWGLAHGLRPWSAQEEILRATIEHRQVAVPSGQGVGKSWTAAWRIAHQVVTAEDPYVVLTAPTGGQLGNVLKPLRQIHDRLGLPGYLRGGNQPAWVIAGDEVMIARSTKDTGTSTLAGPHAVDLLVVVDEADGVAEAVWEQIEGMITGERNRLVTLGNPRDPVSPWRTRLQRAGDKWWVRNLSVLESPHFTGEDVPDALRDALPSRVWLEERRRAWGENSALWSARVRGIWPDADESAFVPLALLSEATRHADHPSEDELEAEVAERVDRISRYVDGRVRSVDAADMEAIAAQVRNPAPLYAVDVSWSGPDRSVIAKIDRGEFSIIYADPDRDTDQLAKRVMNLLYNSRSRVVIDADGVGGPVASQVAAGGYRGRVIEFRAAARPQKPDEYPNVRAEAWWGLRTALEEGLRINPDTPFLEELHGEVAAVRYFEDKKGRIAAEPKDETKRRLGRSPDLGDTLMMAAWAYLKRPTRAVGDRRRPPVSRRDVLDAYEDRMSRRTAGHDARAGLLGRPL